MSIGPLGTSSAFPTGNNLSGIPRYGFQIVMPNLYGGTLWLDAAPDILNNSIDTAHNDAIKAKAKIAYDAFVTEWKGVQ